MRYAVYNTTTNAATPVQVNSAATRVKVLMFKANPANTGTYSYIGLTGMAATTRWSHTKGASPVAVNFGSGSIALSDIYVDVDTDGDKVEVFVVTE